MLNPRQVLVRLKNLTDPMVLFGDDPKEAKRRYRAIMKKFHPDADPNDDDTLMNDITARLSTLWEQYNNVPAADGIFIGHDEIARYVVKDGKIVKTLDYNDDGDLLENEVRALQMLEQSQGYEDVRRYYPLVISADGTSATFEYFDGLGDPAKLWSLCQLAEYFGREVHEYQLAWIWRRLLVALDFAHRNGIIHAGVTPDAIWLNPETHGLVLTNWVHASINQSLIRSMNMDWEEWYPLEVLNKSLPMPGLDFYMAAHSIMWAGRKAIFEIEPLRRYFEWCLTPSQLARPDKFDLLIERFDTTIYDRLGWKKQFVPMEGIFSWDELWTS